MIEPLQKDEAFIADVRLAAQNAHPAHFDVWWLGQSGFLVHWNRHFALLDPYLSDSLTRKYAQTDKPHIRMTERVVDPARLDFIHIVTSSHAHTDHLDAETLVPILSACPDAPVLVPASLLDFAAQRLSCPPARLHPIDDEHSFSAHGFRFTAIPSAHEGLDRDPAGRCLYLGYLIEFGSWRLYHSGDTVRYPGLSERLQRAPIDLAFLPINGRAPERRVAGNLTGEEAAQLACDAHIRTVIPCHYEMFTFNTASPQPFAERCAALGQPCRVMRAGERLTFKSSIGSFP